MQLQTSLAIALALAAIAGGEKAPEQRAGIPPQQAQVTTPTTPANAGQPHALEEKKEGANPVQGQVDPKQAEQHGDFQQRGG